MTKRSGTKYMFVRSLSQDTNVDELVGKLGEISLDPIGSDGVGERKVRNDVAEVLSVAHRVQKRRRRRVEPEVAAGRLVDEESATVGQRSDKVVRRTNPGVHGRFAGSDRHPVAPKTAPA